jgi:hypothetical protein
MDNGAPANGDYDLRFTIYDTSSGGGAIAGPQTNAPVTVSNGLFTVALDFGNSAFNGGDRWLEIGVRNYGNAGSHVVLLPRRQLTSTPYAIRALNAATAALATNLTSPLAGTNISGTIPDARLSANVALLNGNASFSGSLTATQFVGNGSGLINVPGMVNWTTVAGNTVQASANTGYLATNDAVPLIVTLPSSPKMGDICRVTGAGGAGWVIVQNEGQTILSEGIGLNWTGRDIARKWSSVASSADGNKLVAVVGTVLGDTGQIYVSTNAGVSWAARESNRQWVGVASSADGTKLAAIADGGQIFTSTDSGASWTARETGRLWQAVASSADGTKLVAAVFGGQIFTSINSGTNWTARDISRNWYSAASSADGTKMAAVVYDGQFYTSTNSGTNWTARDIVRNWTDVASSADGIRLSATVDGGPILTSVDAGVTWTTNVVPAAPWVTIDCSADGVRLVAAYGDTGSPGEIYTSSDSGMTWSKRTSLNQIWFAVASSTDGSRLVAVANGGQIYTSSQGATTPGTSGYLSGSYQSAIELQYIGNERFIPLSRIGGIVPH